MISLKRNSLSQNEKLQSFNFKFKLQDQKMVTIVDNWYKNNFMTRENKLYERFYKPSFLGEEN